MQFTGKLMLEAAMTSFTVRDVYLYFVGQTLLMTWQSRSYREYFIPTDVIMLD